MTTPRKQHCLFRSRRVWIHRGLAICLLGWTSVRRRAWSVENVVDRALLIFKRDW